MKNEKILILDFGGLNNQTIARHIRDCQVYCEVHPYTMSVEDIKKFNPKGIVLVDDVEKQVNKEILELGLPVLNIVDGNKEQLKDFALNVCKCSGDWTVKDFVNNTIEDIKQKVGDGKVLLALSGGVDSSVCAVLLSKAIGKQLTCVFVDHGLMRKNEADEVESVFGPKGNYDLNTVGEYKLTYKGIDSSNNEVSKDFTLYVKPKTTGGSTNNNTTRSKTYFTDIVKNYKTENTKIGLDVSHWQGNINFQKVKDAGVEFVYIRIGRGNGIGKEFVMDSKFKQNIEGFNSVGIPVGLYFYTYAASKKDAIKEAKWIVENIKDYKVDLEIAFDWENWSFYREFNLSFYELTEVAKAFNKELAKHDYQGMLYSSKNYLENMWFEVDFPEKVWLPTKYPVWLAHYTKQTSYQGKYKVWQICDNGVVDGIPDNQVDINIMYN